MLDLYSNKKHKTQCFRKAAAQGALLCLNAINTKEYDEVSKLQNQEAFNRYFYNILDLQLDIQMLDGTINSLQPSTEEANVIHKINKVRSYSDNDAARRVQQNEGVKACR